MGNTETGGRKAGTPRIRTPRFGGRRALMLSTAALALLMAHPALAQNLPTGGVLAGGAATGFDAPDGAALTISQTSDRAILDWTSFDIGQGYTVTFAQPSASAVAVNRVSAGGGLSEIHGALNANGVVAILNPNGVYFDGSARVDVGGLIVTTAGLANQAEFLSGGPIRFSGATSGAVTIASGAQISISSAGLAAFVAPSVANNGVVTATLGRVALGAGESFTIDLAGDRLLEIGLPAASPLVQNAGQIQADGGRIQLTAAAASAVVGDIINTTGLISVGGASEDNGVIVLEAAGGINLAGTVRGGDVTASGRRIRSSSGASVNTGGTLTMNVTPGGADTTGETLIADALGAIGAVEDGTTLNLGAGLYASGATIGRPNVTIDGAGVARISVLENGQNGLSVGSGGDGATIRNLLFSGPADAPWSAYGWGGTVTRGVFIQNGADDVTVTGNAIEGVRNGVLIDGRNAGIVIAGNLIDNTKSGISVQYTDTTGYDKSVAGADLVKVVLDGNRGGTHGNEWGVNLHLNGYWNGVPGDLTHPSPNPVSSGVYLASAPTAGHQAYLLALSQANNGLSIQDQAYASSNRTHAHVAPGGGATAQGSPLSPIGTIQGGVASIVPGGFVSVANGTYVVTGQYLNIDKSLSLTGASQGGVIIDARGASTYGLRVTADSDVLLSDFTLWGVTASGNTYGVKAEEVTNLTLRNITSRGSFKSEFDLNGVVNGVLENLTADGASVTGGAATGGAGIIITDSRNIELRGSTTLNNGWGGLSLQAANRVTGYTTQTDAIVVRASNTFTESNPIYMEDSSTLHDFGALTIEGYGFIAANYANPANLISYFQKTRAGAGTVLAANGGLSGGFIEGWTGTERNNVFAVDVVGGQAMSFDVAYAAARNGGTISLGAGTFSAPVTLGKSLTLSGAGMNATALTGGISLSGSITDLTLNGFTVRGSSGGNAVISNGGVLTNLTMNAVRIDGSDIAGRHGFVGGQIGGAIAITGSEFVNIDGWAAFDTRSGASANQGSQIESALFSGNLLDNVQGHIAFRQDAAGAFPDMVFANNTVRNVGAATNSFGAIFKAFNASAVRVTGNNISGVGASGFSPSGEAGYGAAVMVRGAGPLTIANNVFRNNRMVFAVEPNRTLPATTDITGNIFENNAYVLYTPASMAGGAGAVNFGANNDVIAGANTIQHIVWRGAGALDLTGVRFNGALASQLSLAQRFALEDLITHGVDVANAGLARIVAGQLHAPAVAGGLVRAVGLASNGDVVNLADGTHALTSTLTLSRPVTIRGQSQAGTVINASTINSYGMLVTANDVSLSNFTFQGRNTSTNSAHYGIKVQPGANVASDRVLRFAISDATVRGFGGSEIDLNGVVGASVQNVTLDGQGTKGAGLAITDSANVTVSGVTTRDNLWGSIALYQANRWFDQKLGGVTINAANSSFGETLGVFLQASSTLHPDVGALNLNGLSFAVRNPDHREGGGEYIFFRRTLGDALAFAVNLNPAVSNASTVRGWASGAADSNLYVGFGALSGGGTRALSIQTAFNASRAGDIISIASGDYAQTATLGAARTVRFDNVTLDALTFAASGSAASGQLAARGNLSFTGLSLTGNLALASQSGGIAAGTVSGSGAFSATANAGAVTLGALNVMSVAVSGNSVTTAGATTSGAQTYSGGAISLAGAYVTNGGAFTLGGPAQLNGAVSVATSGGAVTAGAVSGANALTVGAGAGSVTLGALNVASANVSGGAVTTSGATTSGAQTYSGSAIGLNGAYVTNGAAFTLGGPAQLNGAVSVATSGGAVTAGAVSGAKALTVGAGPGSVTLGALNVASVAISGGAVTTAGAITTGTQTYSGSAIGLSGAYASNGGAFSVSGPAQLNGAVSVATSGGAVTGGAMSGANALTVAAGTGSVALGALNVAAVNLSGGAVTTSGATTAGTQTYSGSAIGLNGAYVTNGGAFSVGGPAQLNGAVSVATSGGAVTSGAVSGAGALTVAAGDGAVTLGALNVTSANVSGGAVTTNGAVTAGGQSFAGSTVGLTGGYFTSGGGFSISGPAQLNGAVSVATSGGAVTAGEVGGGEALTVAAGDGAVTLGALDLASAEVSGGAVTTNGAVTLGGQSFTGASVGLSGAYLTNGGTFAVSGPAQLGGAVSVATSGGAVTTGAVSGASALTVAAGPGAVTLGALDVALAEVSGGVVTTNGAVTLGGQSYTGASVGLNGAYLTNGGAFAIAGPAQLNGAVNVATAGGGVTAGTISGPAALSVSAGTGAVTLGALNAASADISGGVLSLTGATTAGAQSFAGGTIGLSGIYATNGGVFTASGATRLNGAVSVATSGGAASFGAVDGASAGAQSFAVNTGAGPAAFGALGASTRLGAVAIASAETVLNGAFYRASAIDFSGGAVRLTSALTTFDTRVSNVAGGDIAIGAHLIGTASGAQSVIFDAGAGDLPGDGDIALGNVGTDAVRLGAMTVTGGDFSARTVKLAGAFTSTLSGDQVFSANTLDTLGSVSARVAGSGSGPINAGGAVAIDVTGSNASAIVAAGPVRLDVRGSNTGAINSAGPVAVAVQGSNSGAVSSTGAVTLAVQGANSGAVSSSSAVTLAVQGANSGAVKSAGPVAMTVGGSNSGAVDSGGAVDLKVTGSNTSTVVAAGAVKLSVTGSNSGAVNAGGAVAMDVRGASAGAVTSGGKVEITGGGAVSSVITAAGSVSVSTPGSITSTITTPDAVSLATKQPIAVKLNAGAVNVDAPSGSVSGNFSKLTAAPDATLGVNDQVVIAGGGVDARQVVVGGNDRPAPTRAGRATVTGATASAGAASRGTAAPGPARTVTVNSVDDVGDLLGQGYAAVAIDIDGGVTDEAPSEDESGEADAL